MRAMPALRPERESPGDDEESRGPRDGAIAIPEPGTWIRLEHHDSVTGERKAQSRWHRVRGWDDGREQVILLCTGRDRNLSWALTDGVRFIVVRSLLRPAAEDLCQHCLRRANEVLSVGEPPAR